MRLARIALACLAAALAVTALAAPPAAAQNGRAPPAPPPAEIVPQQDRDAIKTVPLPDNPAEAVILIFNHGTYRPQFRHVCNATTDVPGVVRDIAAERRWHVHYLCSTAVDGDAPASYTYKRADEILAVVAAYRAKGVPAKNIFLLGQSAGGWSSLMAARKDHRGFNAIIAFAPAFAGPRHEAAQFPRWRGEYAPQQIRYLRQAPRINALILAFSDDIFDRPSDLAPLDSIPGVEILAFDACGAGHGTAYTECFRTGARAEIADYIRRRLDRR